MILNREDIDAIQARVDGAAPGPWLRDGYGGDPENWREVNNWNRVERGAMPGDGEQITIYDEGGHTTADAEFIAHARTDVPALVATALAGLDAMEEVERLRAQLDEAGRAVQADARQTLEARAALAESQAEVAALEAVADMCCGCPEPCQTSPDRSSLRAALAERDATIAAVRALVPQTFEDGEEYLYAADLYRVLDARNPKEETT